MDITEIKTVADLEKAIEEQAGIGLEDGTVPVGDLVGWFDKAFKRGKPVPFSELKALLTLAIFQDDAEVRVYAISLSAEVSPHRFVLSKHANVMVGELLDIECFIDEISEELQALAKIDHAAALADAAHEAIDSGDVTKLYGALHDYEGDEDEGEDEEEEAVPAVNGGAPSAEP